MLSKVEMNKALNLTDVRIVYSGKNLSLGNSDFQFSFVFPGTTKRCTSPFV